MFRRTRQVLTPTLARAALSPHLEMERKLELDWSPRFLVSDQRREVAGAMEYHGADLSHEEMAGLLVGPRETTRWPPAAGS